MSKINLSGRLLFLHLMIALLPVTACALDAKEPLAAICANMAPDFKGLGNLESTLSVPVRQPLSLKEAVGALRRAGVPLSLITAQEEVILEAQDKAPTAKELLRQIAGLDGYRCEMIANHLVIFPTTPSYQQRLSDSEGNSEERVMVRFAATEELLERIESEVEDWQKVEFGVVVLAGLDPCPDCEKIRVRTGGRVIDRLIGLLGSRDRDYLTICSWYGKRRLTFSAVVKH